METPINKIQQMSSVQHASLTKLHKKQHIRLSLPQQLIPHTPSKPRLSMGNLQWQVTHKKYIHLADLGQGNFSTVYLVQIDGKQYALKKVRDGQQEVDILKQLSHVNIVKYYDSWHDGGFWYIQLKYYPLGDIQDKSVNIIELLRDMSQSLQFIHDRNIVHLDVKPSNIFVDEAHNFVLGDFGTAIVLGSSQQDREEGDVRYLAPEILRGHYTPAADIFSLGIVCFELLTDVQLPLMGQAWHKLRSGDNQIWHELCHSGSIQIQLLIDAMIQPQSNLRPTASQIMEALK